MYYHTVSSLRSLLGLHMPTCRPAREIMPPFKSLNRFLPNFFRILFVLTLLSFLVGCEKRQGLKIGDSPPGFSGTDINGEFVSLSQFKGNVVVLYFWTNSCCGDRLKLLEPFYRRNKDRGLTVLAINEGNAKETVESYAKSNTLTFSFLTDDHKMISGRYGVFGFPTIVILDRNGIIRGKIRGAVEIAKLEKLVSDCLDSKPQQK